ncbi:hypothetical protein A8C32_03525 [Flavivirga aquatica]|uniref:BioF2-like acetyltransferase domain-containing protein n=1 Tax=Flavivirga aquatica TaxID=1849968 RepID=A0A1E5TB11_9FLAO|nr:GNAT family N-acetyltransferase [Flavivirga aquatica]OEK08536.1 hypothetical protein A8C32_03525 [Flavivirga aquatica]
MRHIKHITFLKALLSNNSLPLIYKAITNNTNLFYNTKTDSILNLKNHVLIVKDIPNYLNITIEKHLNKTFINKIKTLKGHLIELHNYQSISDYLNHNFSTKSRSNLRRYKNRLETCFNIKYVSYYGNIEKQEYDRLFIVLKDLLERRFNEKGEINYELQYLNEFNNIVYEQILNKKANLFVIYDGNKPISIRINMLKDKLNFYILSGYDIDYSKFHIGSLDMLKNIEWSIQNNIKSYDLLKGYDYYKKKWATKSYYYSNHIIYNSNSIKIFIIGKLTYIKYTLKYKTYNLLKNKYIDIIYRKFKKGFFSKNNLYQKKDKTFILSNSNTKNSNKITKINIEQNNEYQFLRKPVYDFLFLNNESINNITVNKFTDSTQKFQIQSKNKIHLLTVIN